MKKIISSISKNFSHIHFFGENSILNRNTGEKLFFDETQTDILKLCNEGNSVEDIHKKLFKIYSLESDEEKEQGKYVINEFLSNMMKENIIEFVDIKSHSPIHITGEAHKYYPNTLFIELLNYCNLSCSHCLKNANSIGGDMLSLDEIKNIVNIFKNKTSRIVVTGGEPLIHPQINEILEVLTSNFKVSIITNGTYLHRIDKTILKRIVEFHVSMYGIDEAIYNDITKSSKAFEDFKGGLNILNELNKEFAISIVLNQINKNNIEEYIKFSIMHNASTFRLGFPLPLGRAVKDSASREIWTLSDSDVTNINKDIISFKEKYGNEIKLPGIIEIDSEKTLTGEYENFFEEIYPDCFSCGAGISLLSITASGKITPCEILQEECFSICDLSNINDLIDGKYLGGFRECILKFEKKCINEDIDLKKVCGKITRLLERCHQ